MSWRIIYIEKSDYLSTYLDNLKVRKGIDDITIPFNDINSIVIDNQATTITVPLINKCVQYKVNLVICDCYHLPSSIIIPYTNNYQQSLMLNKQIKWQEEAKAYLWKKIIEAKLINQREVLKYLKKEKEAIEILSKYIDEVELLDSTNREGLGAKIYFRALFGSNFIRREESIINTCLNYGYAIFRSQIARSLVAHGLNAHFGIFHKGAENEFNLADDLLEVFRPAVDIWVYKNINDDSLFIKETRLRLVELGTKKINYGNKVTIINAMNILIEKIIYYFETGDISNLTFPFIIEIEDSDE